MPYFGLIIIYFLFINLEATKDKSIINGENRDSDSIFGTRNNKKNVDNLNNNIRISIPVIPYKNNTN